ncbi:MAG: hypothetical protein HC921_17035 [Synechococcaceae cyanobacterium SM2_3_1]|nr:hypothetical protein [Synechococcaceae cyanobacterium SM2_3_1]
MELSNKEDFLNPHSSYSGKAVPAQIVFNANLQEFSNRVDMICALETGGKIEPMEAYRQIKALWKELKASKKEILDNPDLSGAP